MQPISPPSSDKSDLLLVNPRAGGGRAAAALFALREFAHRRGWTVDIIVTQTPNDLAREACRAAESGQKRIFVLGGDGTFQLLVNAVAGYPQTILGVIPAGTGNDLAAAVGLPADPVQAAALLLQGVICELDVARVRTSEGNERFYTGGGGVGLDAEAAQYANGAYRRLPGRYRYLMAAIRALVSFDRIPVKVIFEEDEPKALEARTLLVAVLNTPSYGGGLCLAPQAKTNDGRLDVVILEDSNFGRILTWLPALAFSGQLKTQRLRRFHTTHIRIETDPPCRFHGDGEILGMTPVEVSIVPRAIRVLRPAQKSMG